MLLSDHQSAWPSQFNKIRKALRIEKCTAIIGIEHIGSTAVPDLAAKPIIDIDLIYKNPLNLAQVIAHLQVLDYEHVGDRGIAGREVFKRIPGLNHPFLDDIDHHLYACPADGEELQRHIDFRNYLRKFAEMRMEYERLKMAIAKQAGYDRKKYAVIKEVRARPFIMSCLKLAHDQYG